MLLLCVIKGFIEQYGICVYSEYLLVCVDDGQFYDLMLLLFSDELVCWVVEWVRVVQDVFEWLLIVENVLVYVCLLGELEEVDFVCVVLEEVDC